MEDPRNNNDAQRLVNRLTDLFDAVAPTSRTEAEEELRGAGANPEEIGRHIEQLAARSLGQAADAHPLALRRREQSDSASIHAPMRYPALQRRRLTARRALLSSAAVLAICVLSWLMLRPAERIPPAEKLALGSAARQRDAQPRNLGQARTAARQEARSTDAVEKPVVVSEDPAAKTLPVSRLPAEISSPTGGIVTADSLDDHEALLSPGVQWAVERGMRLRSVETRPIRPPRAYREATERYAGTVRLAPDGLSLENYVAGLPFPHIDPNDSQAALKIMWNYEHRFMPTDDFEARGFVAESGILLTGDEGAVIERTVRIAEFRRLYYSGRLYRDPRPILPDPQGVRFRELLRIAEPFDLKGDTIVSIRHSNANTPDDTWLHVPALRRVRSLSTAARSDGLFGLDADIDSFFGFNGSVATMDWKFLGERTVLACLHAENFPAKWGESSADFAFDDVWEPRSVYVIEGVAKSRYYAYSKRVLYIDREAWVVPYSDLYDRNGQLWKVWINMFSVRSQPSASNLAETVLFAPAAVMIDVQRLRVTRMSFPDTKQDDKSGWFVNQGLSEDSLHTQPTVTIIR